MKFTVRVDLERDEVDALIDWVYWRDHPAWHSALEKLDEAKMRHEEHLEYLKQKRHKLEMNANGRE